MVDELIVLVLKIGEIGVWIMVLFDKVNIFRYGNLEIIYVNIGIGICFGILISGYDLYDLEELLE